MIKNKLAVFGTGLALSLAMGSVACGDGGNEPPTTSNDAGDTGESSDTSTEDTGTTETGTEDTGADTGDSDGCHATIEGGAAIGEACGANDECESNFCLGYSDAPDDPNAMCEPAPNECKTRCVGQVLEFGSNAPVAGIGIRVVGAIGASVNPVGAMAHAEGNTDDMGRYDLTTATAIQEPLGIIGMVDGDGYFLAATGLASPLGSDSNDYGPANEIRDLWAVPQSELDSWNAALAGDAELAEYLPMGEKGGVIGLVRSRETGDPVAGITIESTDPDGSNAFVRYLNEAGDAFDGTATSSNGIYIILNPALAEEFDALNGGEPTAAPTGTAGSTNNSLFVLIMGV